MNHIRAIVSEYRNHIKTDFASLTDVFMWIVLFKFVFSGNNLMDFMSFPNWRQSTLVWQLLIVLLMGGISKNVDKEGVKMLWNESSKQNREFPRLVILLKLMKPRTTWLNPTRLHIVHEWEHPKTKKVWCQELSAHCVILTGNDQSKQKLSDWLLQRGWFWYHGHSLFPSFVNNVLSFVQPVISLNACSPPPEWVQGYTLHSFGLVRQWGHSPHWIHDCQWKRRQWPLDVDILSPQTGLSHHFWTRI